MVRGLPAEMSIRSVAIDSAESSAIGSNMPGRRVARIDQMQLVGEEDHIEPAPLRRSRYSRRKNSLLSFKS
ncbi:hypothetical protein BCM02_101827 [Paenibacillus methanolicus]|uniref:Uncharacterized protein n=2 Tax=Paenibacillus methanolicus TaxID=582686 RepID=A0A5S5CIT0_9BACL|nr:hypothetical protein BCM02_101827 [Paenibacillus methanolicus]